ncbi:MAG: DUF2066 domain-containing protein [Rhodospirillales bacterium]|nr:DUF2066 domain-containing protein [Rhodospirillales bacterium]MDE2575963.1 DUF2066 domain-containing protein [Rhodospirillales bacterium]
MARHHGPMIALLLALPAAPAAAQTLYGAQTIVSGTVPATRGAGLAACLADVLVKVSGNPALRGDPRVAALGAQAGAMATDFAYIDRMSDEPHHDEQGSRDRPFTLVAHFAPARIAAALRALGEHPWQGPRPDLAMHITIHDRADTYPLTADADAGERQREALLAAADRYALHIVLPVAVPPTATPAALPTLVGTLRWSDADFGWVGAWHLRWQGRESAWGVRGVSFDAAYRNAVRGALGVLSGHGAGGG